MKERPILFSTPMVQAILSGQKTMTRRVMKLQRHTELYPCGTGKQYWSIHPGDLKSLYYKCPYGAISDRLWVRETFARTGDNFHDDWPGHSDFYYKADDPYSELEPGSVTTGIAKWRPSIHMPRDASRITLEITNIRVERLQDISEEDAMREGVQPGRYVPFGAIGLVTFKEGFLNIWDEINGAKYPVSSNPWVWVVEFKKVEAK